MTKIDCVLVQKLRYTDHFIADYDIFLKDISFSLKNMFSLNSRYNL